MAPLAVQGASLGDLRLCERPKFGENDIDVEPTLLQPGAKRAKLCDIIRVNSAVAVLALSKKYRRSIVNMGVDDESGVMPQRGW